MKTQNLRVLPFVTKAVAWWFLANVAMSVTEAAAHYELLKTFGWDNVISQERGGVLYGCTRTGEVFKLAKDGKSDPVILKVIPMGYRGGAYRPIVDSDGSLYGVMEFQNEACAFAGTCGDADQQGAVFRLNDDFSGFTMLAGLGTNGVDRFGPNSIIVGSDGFLYGSAYSTVPGVASLRGTVFKLTKDGSDYHILHIFSTNTNMYGAEVPNSLMEGRDGLLYGTTGLLIFKLNKDGSGFEVLRDISELGLEFPSSLIESGDGALYGTTDSSVFMLTKDGSQFRILRSFAFDDGYPKFPRSLLEGNDGALYGVTGYGSTNDWETLFGLNRDGSGYRVLRSFVGFSGHPMGLVKAGDGAFYGGLGLGPCVCEGLTGGIFRLWPEQTPDLTLITTGNGARQVSIAGVEGFRYRLLVSTNLVVWSPLTTFTMPVTGAYTYNGEAVSNSIAFYRAAWMP